MTDRTVTKLLAHKFEKNEQQTTKYKKCFVIYLLEYINTDAQQWDTHNYNMYDTIKKNHEINNVSIGKKIK